MLEKVQGVESAPQRSASNDWAEPAPVTVSNVIQMRRAAGVTGDALIAFKEGGAVQHKGGARDTSQIHEAAASGLSGSASALPHLDAIQKSFGDHDVSGVKSFVGGAAASANEQMGSLAYATGDNIAFKSSPDLHTAAHEAAHVVQQRQGVSLSGGVGQVGDRYEQHADAVADAVVQGRSAESLLSTGASGGGAGVQMRAVQLHAGGDHTGEPEVTPVTEHDHEGEHDHEHEGEGELEGKEGEPHAEGSSRRGGPMEKARAQKILQEAFGDIKGIDAGKVELLEQAAFKAAWEKIYGKTKFAWDTYVVPVHGNLNGFAHKGVNYVNKSTANVGTVPHEMLHNNTAADFIPFVGSEFNEGSTDVLKQHALKKAGVKSPNSYPNQIKCVEKFLASGVSKEQLFTAYLKGGAAQIVGKHVDNTCKGNWAAVKNAMQKKDWASARANLAKK